MPNIPRPKANNPKIIVNKLAITGFLIHLVAATTIAVVIKLPRKIIKEPSGILLAGILVIFAIKMNPATDNIPCNKNDDINKYIT